MTEVGSIRPLRTPLDARVAADTMPTTRLLSARATAAPLNPGARGCP